MENKLKRGREKSPQMILHPWWCNPCQENHVMQVSPQWLAANIKTIPKSH